MTQLWQVVLELCTGEMQLRFTDPTTTTRSMNTNTTAAMPVPCGPDSQRLLVAAAEALEMSLIPDWDEGGRRELWTLRMGRVQPYWTTSKRRHLARTDLMAASALCNYSAVAQGPEIRAAARELAAAIRNGDCAIW